MQSAQNDDQSLHTLPGMDLAQLHVQTSLSAVPLVVQYKMRALA